MALNLEKITASNDPSQATTGAQMSDKFNGNMDKIDAALLNAPITTTGTSTAYILNDPRVTNINKTGSRVFVKFHTFNGASATLNVNNTGANQIRFRSSEQIIQYRIQTGSTLSLSFDGSYWIVENTDYVNLSMVNAYAITIGSSELLDKFNTLIQLNLNQWLVNIGQTINGIITALGKRISDVIVNGVSVVENGIARIDFSEGGGNSGASGIVPKKFNLTAQMNGVKQTFSIHPGITSEYPIMLFYGGQYQDESTNYTVDYVNHTITTLFKTAPTSTKGRTLILHYFGNVKLLYIDPIPDIEHSGVKVSQQSNTEGDPRTPVPQVRGSAGGALLFKDTDYTVAYENNTDLGAATVHVTGIGEYAGINGMATFNIVPRVIQFNIDNISNKPYTGSQITPTVRVRDGEKTLADYSPGTSNLFFTAVYGENINVGTESGSVSLTGIGIYAGSTGYKTFNII